MNPIWLIFFKWVGSTTNQLIWRIRQCLRRVLHESQVIVWDFSVLNRRTMKMKKENMKILMTSKRCAHRMPCGIWTADCFLGRKTYWVESRKTKMVNNCWNTNIYKIFLYDFWIGWVLLNTKVVKQMFEWFHLTLQMCMTTSWQPDDLWISFWFFDFLTRKGGTPCPTDIYMFLATLVFFTHLSLSTSDRYDPLLTKLLELS